MNHREVHSVLADYAAKDVDIVVPISHLFQFSEKGVQAINGAQYIYKKHYWNSTTSLKCSLLTYSALMYRPLHHS